nr:MAG TPA: hypothetical protein [Caudoviricetes sp.]
MNPYYLTIAITDFQSVQGLIFYLEPTLNLS